MTTSGDTRGRIETTGGPGDPPAEPRAKRRRFGIAALLIAALVLGILGRSLLSGGVSNSFLVDLLPWLRGTSITLFFGDGTPSHLVPVSRTLSGDEESPEGMVRAFLDGPEAGTGLVSLVPADAALASASLDGGTLTVEIVDSGQAGWTPLGEEALVQSLRSWSGVERMVVTIGGRTVRSEADGRHLLFYYAPERDMLVAQPVAADAARDVLDAWLAGPDDEGLIGLPADVRVLQFEPASRGGLLKLNMTYSPMVREFAVADGDAMRRILEGLITTLTTGFSETPYVYLDFEGRASLGLGQCANLLRTAQPPPDVLNDERLLRTAAVTP